MTRSGERLACWMTLAVAAGTTGCAAAERIVVPPVPAQLAAVSGDAQQGVVHQSLTAAILVKATTAAGAPVPGVRIRWSVSNGGTISRDSITNANGQVSVVWTLGTIAGVQRLDGTAGAPDAGLNVTFTARAMPTAATSLAIVSGDAQSGVVSSALPLPLIAVVSDSFGNGVLNAAIAWTADSSSGTISADARTDSAGHSAARWIMPTIAGRRAAHVTSGALAASISATARADVPAQLVYVSGGGQTGPYGVTLVRPLVSRVLDRFGNVVPNATVSVTTSGGASAPSAAVTDSNGVASVRVRLPMQYGSSSVSFTVPNGGTTSFTLTSNPVRFASISAGDRSTCGLSIEGYAYCWGWNAYLQLGIGNTQSAQYFTRPMPVVTDQVFTRLSQGSYGGCGVAGDGRMWCWGVLDPGNPREPGVAGVPYLVAPDQRFKDVAVGVYHTCALSVAGDPWCWGNSDHGQSGFNGWAQQPNKVPGVEGSIAIAVGYDFSCVLAWDGRPFCWGNGASGRLGLATPMATCADGGPCTLYPQVADTATGFVAISAGFDQACVLDGGGHTRCWGGNQYGELGNGNVTPQSSPGPIALGATYRSISTRYFTTCGLTTSGQSQCWGFNLGVFGIPQTNCTVPGTGTIVYGCQSVPLTMKWPSLASASHGDFHVCGLDAAGTAWCIGDNSAGQLGDGTGVSRGQMVKVLGQP